MKETKVSIILPGAPVTKKNSPRIAPIRYMKGGRQVTIYKIQPSKAYERWAKSINSYGPLIRRQLEALPLPLANSFNLAIKVWVARARFGDLVGYQESVLDILQATFYREKVMEENGAKFTKTVRVREGVGIYQDDAQCVSTDNCRVAGIDRTNPRVEVTLTFYDDLKQFILPPAAEQGSLFEEEEEDF